MKQLKHALEQANLKTTDFPKQVKTAPKTKPRAKVAQPPKSLTQTYRELTAEAHEKRNIQMGDLKAVIQAVYRKKTEDFIIRESNNDKRAMIKASCNITSNNKTYIFIFSRQITNEETHPVRCYTHLRTGSDKEIILAPFFQNKEMQAIFGQLRKYMLEQVIEPYVRNQLMASAGI